MMTHHAKIIIQEIKHKVQAINAILLFANTINNN